jgi:hypothetical protein
MADQATTSQVHVQAEYETAPQAVVSQVHVQVEYMIPTSGAPTQERLLRHGSWFGSSVKQRFWWAR